MYSNARLRQADSRTLNDLRRGLTCRSGLGFDPRAGHIETVAIIVTVLSFLLSVTFTCGLVIAVAHVINRSFIAPVYDVALNLIAFVSAVGASVLLGHWPPALLSACAVVCWLILARRTYLHLRESAHTRDETR